MIDYKLLGEAQSYYSKFGYNYIEVPWMVSANCDNITKPDDIQEMKIEYNGKHIIASGEQGFLYLRMKGYINNGRYQTITPCFRNEAQDNIHQKMFMKCELIEFVPAGMDLGELKAKMNDIAKDAYAFFEIHAKDPNELNYTAYNESPQCRTLRNLCKLDIEYRGFEIGSYGIREYNDIAWIYGTGIAEPRFSKINSIRERL